MKITDEQTIHERVGIIEEAMAKVLDRDGSMQVEAGDDHITQYVWVIKNPWSDERIGFSLNELAREMEVLLS